MGHHLAAFLDVARILFRRAEDEGPDVRYDLPQERCGPDIRLHVLDRHHTPDQRDGGRSRRRVLHEGREPVVIHAVRDDDEPVGGSAIPNLENLVSGIEGGDPAAGLVAGACVSRESIDPDIPQTEGAPLEFERVGQLIPEPIRHRDLDAALVRVDSVLREEPGPSCFEHGARHEDPGIARGDRVVDLCPGQRRQQDGKEPAGKSAPAPEIVQERTAGDRTLVHPLDEAEGRFGVEESRPGSPGIVSAHDLEEFPELGEASTLEQARQRLLDLRGEPPCIRSARHPTLVTLKGDHGHSHDVRRQNEPAFLRSIVGGKHDERRR